MIILEDLKPILEPLLEGREDAIDVIEQVTALDKEPEPSADVEALNAEWQGKLDEAIAEAAKDKEETIKRIFFGEEKAEGMDTSIPEVTDNVTDDIKEEKDAEPSEDDYDVTIDEIIEQELIK